MKYNAYSTHRDHKNSFKILYVRTFLRFYFSLENVSVITLNVLHSILIEMFNLLQHFILKPDMSHFFKVVNEIVQNLITAALN